MAEIRKELLDELLADYESREDLVGPDGLIKQLFARLIEAAAGAELTEHLGYERGDAAGRGSGNSRNGTTPKTLLTEWHCCVGRKWDTMPAPGEALPVGKHTTRVGRAPSCGVVPERSTGEVGHRVNLCVIRPKIMQKEITRWPCPSLTCPSSSTRSARVAMSI
jgi:Transposase, Mutator family